MTALRRPSRKAVETMHAEQLEEHGGLAGFTDEHALESARAWPLNRAASVETDVKVLAAAYLYVIAGNQPFSGGNKRPGFLADHTVQAG